ncbi:MAG: GNAT family N-acetyltransferase [Candidatus Hermodarchaeota archaeon]
MDDILIRNLTQLELEHFTKCLADCFEHKFQYIFKGIPKEEYKVILRELILAVQNPANPFPGEFIAVSNGSSDNLNDNNHILGCLTVKIPSFKEEYDKEAWKVLRNHFSYLKRLRIGILLGALSKKIRDLESDELYIDSICVFEKYRGKGYGSQLLNFCVEFAKSNKLKKVSLWVSSVNHNAIKLYTKLGFIIRKAKKSRITKKNLNIPAFYYMVKELR